jgi:hypothetical protein
MKGMTNVHAKGEFCVDQRRLVSHSAGASLDAVLQ